MRRIADTRLGFFALLAVMAGSAPALAQTREYDAGAAADTTWENDTNWTGDDEPDTTGEDAQFRLDTGDDTVTLNNDRTIRDLIINPDASSTWSDTFVIQGNSTLAVTSATITNNNGTTPTLQIDNGNNNILQVTTGFRRIGGGTIANNEVDFGIRFALNGNGTWQDSGTGSWGAVRVGLNGTTSTTDTLVVTAAGGISTGALDIEEGVLDLATNDVAMTITGNVTIQNGGTFTLGAGTVTITGNVTINDGGTLTCGSGQLIINGNLTINTGATGGTFTGGSGTIDLNGDFTQTAGGPTTATFTQGTGTMSISGTLNYDSNTVNEFNINVNGLIVLDGATLTINPSDDADNPGGGAGSLQTIGNLQLSPSAAAALTIPNNRNVFVRNLIIDSNATLNLDDGEDLFIGGDLTVNGTLDIDGNPDETIHFQVSGNTAINNGATFDASGSSAALQFLGNVIVDSGSTFTAGGGNFTFSGGGAQSWQGGGKNFVDVQITNNSTVTLNTTGATVTDFVIDSGSTLTINAVQLTQTANLANGDMDGTVTFDNSATWQITGSVEIDGTLNTTTGIGGVGTLHVNGSLSNNGAGTINAAGSGAINVTIDGTADFEGLSAAADIGTGTLTLDNAGNQTINFRGGETIGNIVATGSGTKTFNDTNGGDDALSLSQTLTLNGANADFNAGNIPLTVTGATSITNGTLDLEGGTASTFTGNVTLNASGVLDGNNTTINVTGNFDISAGTFNPGGSGTLNFNGTSQTFTIAADTTTTIDTLTVNSSTRLDIDPDAASTTENLIVADGVTISSGVVDLTVRTTFQGATTTIASGATLQNTGSTAKVHTFSGATSNDTVTLNGAMTFTGAGHTLTFNSAANDDLEIGSTGSFTLNGSPGTATMTDGSDDGNTWDFNANASATISISNTSIVDSVNTGGGQTPILVVASPTTDGDSTNWINGRVWGGGTGSPPGTYDTNWTTATNWTGDQAPGAGEFAVFNSASNAINGPTTGTLTSIGGILVDAAYNPPADPALGGNLTLTSNLLYNATGGGVLGLGTSTLIVQGTANTLAGTIGTGTGTLRFTGAAALTQSSTPTVNATLDVTGTLTPQNNTALTVGTLTVATTGNLNLASNDPNLSVGAVTLTGSGAITADAGTLTASGNWSSGGSLALSGTHSLVLNNGGGSISTTTGDTFQNVVVTSNLSHTAGNAWAISGNLDVSAGTLSSSVGVTVTGTTQVDGALTFSAGTPALNGDWVTASTGVLTVQGTANLTLDGTTLNFSSSDIQQGGTATVTLGTTDGKTLTVTAADNFPNLTVSGSTTVSGTLDVNGDLVLNDDFTFGTGGGAVSGTVSGTAGALTLDGTVTVSGTGASAFDLSNLTLSAGIGTDRLNLDGATPTITTNGQTFNILQISATNPAPVSGTLTCNSTLDIDTGGITLANAANQIGALDMVNGTLTLAGTSLVVGGAWSQTGGTFTPGTTRVDLNAGGGSTIQAAGTFNGLRVTGAGTYTATGNINVSGALELQSAGGLTYANGATNTAGSVNLSSTGDLTGNNGTLTVSGSWTTAANTFVNGGMAVTIDAAATITQTDTSNPFANLSTTAAVGVSGSLDVNGALGVTGGTLTLPNATHDVDGNVTVNGGTISFNATSCVLQVGGSWNLTGAVGMTNLNDADVQIVFDTNSTDTITPAGFGFGDLRINNGSSSVTASAALTVADQLDVDGGTLNANGGITVAGLIDIQGGTLAGTTVDADGNLSIGSGSFTASALSFTGTGAQTLDDDTATPGQNYGALTVNNGNNGVSLIGTPGDIRVNSLTLTNGSLTLGGNQISFVGNSQTPISITTGTLNGNAGTVRYASSAAGTVTIQTAGVTYQNLTVDSAGNVFQPDNNVTLNASGSLTVSAGTLNGSTFTFTVPGDFNTTGGTFSAGTSLVILNGGAAQAIQGGPSFNTLRIAKGGGTATVTGSLTATTLDIDAGELALDTNGASIGTGGLDQDGGTLTANAAASTIVCTGNWDIAAGTFTAGASTVRLDGANAVSIIQNSQAFNGLICNKGAGGSASVTGQLVVSGQLDIDNGGSLNLSSSGGDVGGTVDIGGGTLVGNATANTLTVAGGWNRTAGSFTPNATTVEFDGGVQSIVPGGVAFGAIRINGTGTDSVTGALTCTQLTIDAGSLSLGGTTAINGALAINANSLDANGNAVTVTGNATIDSGLTVDNGGNVDLQGGTYSGTGTINLNGNAELQIRAATVNLSTLTAFNGAGTSTLRLDGAGTHTLTVGGAVTLVNLACDQNVTIGGATALTTSGNVTISAGTLTLTNTGASLGGLVSGAGALSATGAVNVSVGGGLTVTTYTAGSGTLTFTGTGDWGGATTNNYGVVNVNPGGGNAVSATVTPRIVTDITVSSGTLAMGARQLTVNGNFDASAAAFTQTQGSAVVFNNGGTRSLNGGGNTLGALSIGTSTNVTLNITGAVSVSGAVLINDTGDTVNVNAGVTTFGSGDSATTLNGIVNVAADLTFGGSMTMGASSQLTCTTDGVTLRFAEGGAFLTDFRLGTTNINPGGGNNVNLFSEGSSQWRMIHTPANATFANLSVQRSDNQSPGGAQATATNGTDLGSNLNWAGLTAVTAVWVGSGGGNGNNWDNTSNWQGGNLPVTGSSIVIDPDATQLPQDNWDALITGQGITSLGSLTFNASAGAVGDSDYLLRIQGTQEFDLTGAATIAGASTQTVTFQVSVGAANCSVAGLVSGADTVFDASGTTNATIAGGLTIEDYTAVSGTLTLSGGTWTDSGATSNYGTVSISGTVTTGSSLTMNALAIATGVTFAPVATHNITCAGAVSGLGTISLTNNVTLNIAGDLSVSNFTSGTSSVLNFNGTGAQSWGSSPTGTGFGQVQVTGNGAQVSLGGAKTVDAGTPALLIAGAGTNPQLRLNGQTLTVTGNMTLGDGGGNGGDLVGDTAGTVSISGDLTFRDDSTVNTPANVSVSFTGAGPHILTVVGTTTGSIGNLTVATGTTVRPAGTSPLVTEDCTIQNTGNLDGGTNNFSFTFNGDVDLTGTFSFNTAGTFTFGGTTTNTLNPGGKTFPNVVVTGSGKVLNQNAGSLTINGTTTISGGADLQVNSGTANFANDGDGAITVTGAGSVLLMAVNTNFQDAVTVTGGGAFNAPETGTLFTLAFDTAVATALSIDTGSSILIGTTGGLAADVDLRPYNGVNNDWTIFVHTGATQNIRDVRVRFSTVIDVATMANADDVTAIGNSGVDLGNNDLDPNTTEAWIGLIAVNPTWTGAVSGDWTVDGNWNPSAPTPGSTCTFDVAGTNNPSPATQPSDLAGIITTTNYTGTLQLGTQLNLSTLSISHPATGTFDLNGQVLTVNNSVTLNTHIDDTNGAGSVRFVGGGQGLTINAGGASINALVNIGFGTATTVTAQAGSGRLQVEELNIANTSTFSTGTADIAVLVTNTTTVTGTLTANDSDVTLNGALTVTGSLTGGTGTWVLGSNLTTTGSTSVNFGTNLVQVTGASTFNLANTTFGGNLTTLPGAANTVNLNAGNLDVNGGFTIQNGTFTFTAGTTGDIEGGFSLSVGATCNANDATINDAGFLTLSGTFNAGSSTIITDGNAQSITLAAGVSLFNLQILGGGGNNDTVTGLLDVNGALTINGDNLVLQAGQGADIEGNLTVTSGTFNLNTANVNVAGTTITLGTISNPNGSTFTLDGTTQGFNPNGQTFHSVTIANGSTTTLNGAITVSNTAQAGVLGIIGTLVQNGNTITLQGSGSTPMTGTGTFTGNGLVRYSTSGTGPYNLPALQFDDVELNQNLRTFRNLVAVTLGGTLTINAGNTFQLNNTFTVASVTNNNVLDLNFQTIRVTGATPFGGNAPTNLVGAANVSTVDYAGTPNTQTIANFTYGNLIFSGTGGGTYTLPNPLTCQANITLSNGATFDAGSNITFSGTTFASVFNSNTSSVNLGTLTVNKLDFTSNGAVNSPSELQFTGSQFSTRSVTTLTLTSGLLSVNEDATIRQGTIGQAGDPAPSGFEAQLRVATTGVNLTVGQAGTTSTITIEDSVQIGFGASGVICTMASGGATTTTFALNNADAELRFQGASGNNCQVLTSTSGSQGFITGPGTVTSGRGASALNASVRDNDATGYAAGQVTATSSIDLGNNENWDFQGGGNITAIRGTALGDGNGRIDRIQIMFGGTTGLQASSLGTVHQQFQLVQLDGSGGTSQSITGTASQIASTPSSRGLIVTFGTGLGKTDIDNVEVRYTAPSSGFLTNTAGVPASISFTLSRTAGTLQDGAEPVLISSFFQDLDANDALDRGSFFFSEPAAFKAGCGYSISGWNPVTDTGQMSGNTLLTLEIAGEQLATFDVAPAPFTTGAQIAAEIQNRVRAVMAENPPGSSNPGGHNGLNRPAYLNFTATFDGQRYIFKAGVPLSFNSTTGQYSQNYAGSTVRVITGGANDASPNLGMGTANGGVERAGRGNARHGMSVSRSFAASGATAAAMAGQTLTLQINGEVARSYAIPVGATAIGQIANNVENLVRNTANDSTQDPDSIANADGYSLFVAVPDASNGGRLIFVSGQQGSGSSVVVDSLSPFATVANIGSNFFPGGAREDAGVSNTEVFLDPLSIRLSDGSNPLLGKSTSDVSIAGNVVTVDFANIDGTGVATPTFLWKDDGSGVFFGDTAPVPLSADSPTGNLTTTEVVIINGDTDGDLSLTRSPGAQIVDASSSVPPLGTTGVNTDYSWAFVSGPSDPLSGSAFNGPALSFSATTAGTYVFRLTITVTDGSGNPVVTPFSDGSGRLIRDVTVVISESSPVANAGSDQTIVNTTLAVQLDGSGSFDPNGGSIAYMWSATDTSGNLVTPSPFDDDTIVNPVFTAPSSGRYTITLTVRKTSDETNQASDTASIQITDANSLFPVADAGVDQVGRISTTITLDGSGSSHPSSSQSTLTYAWSVVSSPEPVTLSDAAAVGPSFTPSTPGSYVFGLVVQSSNPVLTSKTDQVTIQVIDDQAASPRLPPAAVARVAGLRRAVFLTGAAPSFTLTTPPVFLLNDGNERDVTVIDLASDAGDDPLSNAVSGFHKLEVYAGGNLFATLYAPQVTGDDQVVQLRPIKGETTVHDVVAYGVAGESFVLDATNSQDDAVVSTATWTQVSGPFQFSSQTGELLGVVPQSAGTYVFDLVVTDNIGLSSFAARVAVPVLPAGLTSPAGPPSAAATVVGGQTITIDEVVTFVAGQNQTITLSAAGSISRASGVPQTGASNFTYQWTQLFGPTAVFAATDAEQVTAQVLTPGGYLFQVQVTDTNGVSALAQVWVSVGPTSATALVPAIASVQDVTLSTDGTGVTVTLDGGQSEGNGTITYQWSQTAGVPAFVSLVQGTGGAQGQVVITEPGTYTFVLRLSNGSAVSSPQTISFKVSAPAETPLPSGASVSDSSGGCALAPAPQASGLGGWLFLALALCLLGLRRVGAAEARA